MKNCNSTPNRNNYYVSANGKSFPAQYILDVVTKLARRFARTKSHTMDQYDIEDLTMEVMVKLQSGFSHYDCTRPLEAWLGTIVYREGCDYLHKQIVEMNGRRRMAEEMDEEPYGDYTDAYVIRKENEEQYQHYLDSIKDEEKRECMRLAGEHWKAADIAKEIGWPADKVHRTVCREKKKLEKE